MKTNSLKTNRTIWLGVAVWVVLLLLASPRTAQAQTWNGPDGSNNISNANTGNVGVGLTVPLHKFDVLSGTGIIARFGSSASADSELLINAASGYNSSLTLQNGGTSKWHLSNRANNGDRFSFIAKTTDIEVFSILQNGKVGIGTTSPNALFSVSANSTTLPALVNSTQLIQLGGADGGNAALLLDAFGGSPAIHFRRANGTNASKTAIASGDLLGAIGPYGFDGSNYTTTAKVLLGMSASENWSSTAQGTHFDFHTTAPGTTTRAERLRITGSGNVGIGTTTPIAPLQIGSSPADSLGLQLGATVGSTSYTTTSKIRLIGLPQSNTNQTFLTFIRDRNPSTQFVGAASFRLNSYTTSGLAPASQLTIALKNTNDNTDIANVDVMTLRDNGNVGIGMAPASGNKLDVAGNINSTGTISATGVINASGLNINGSPVTTSQWMGSGPIYYTGGNVGIGTTSPGYLLDIRQSSSSNQLHVSGTGNDDGLYLLGYGTNGAYMSGGAMWNGTSWIAKAATSTTVRGNAGELQFWTDSGLTPGNAFSPSNRMTITSAGNVGIGTASPQGNLNVKGQFVFFDDSAGAISGGLYANALASNPFTMWSGAGDFRIGTGVTNRTSGAGFSERIRILNSNGNVGIGTTGPTFKLDVQNGSINTSEGLCIAGVCKTDWSQVGGGSSQWAGTGPIYYTGGNVGIGTLTFGANGLLQVNGSIGLSGARQIRPASNADADTLQFLGTKLTIGTLNSHAYGYAGGGLISSVSPAATALLLDVGGNNAATAHRLKITNDTTGVTGSLFYGTPTVTALYANSANGNVGIGTIAPAEKLSIGGLTTGSDSFVYLGSEGLDIGEYRNGLKFRVHDNNYGFTIQSENLTSAQGLNILRHQNSAGGTSALYIARSSGNVGIGMSAPLSPLHVQGEIRATQIRFSDDSVQSTANLTNLNASNLTSGTLPTATFPTTLPVLSGVNLTNLNAANLGSGLVSGARMPALTGDVTTTAGSVATTLTNSGVSAGSYTNASITVDSKGRLTAASSGSGGSTAFSSVTTGTNTVALVVGSGGSLGVSGSGTINATTLGGASFAAPGAIGGTTPGSGAFSTVGINTAPSSYKLDVNGNSNVTGNVTVGGTGAGNITATGTIEGGNIKAKYQDMAEWVPTSEQIFAGTVVVLDTTKSNQVIASTQSYDTRVAGVISAQPGITLGEGGEGKVLVATTGRVLVQVDASKGAIHIGDLLVTSDVPGVAMKSTPVNLSGIQLHRPGTIIGKALEPLEKGSGKILVLLSLQ